MLALSLALACRDDAPKPGGGTTPTPTPTHTTPTAPPPPTPPLLTVSGEEPGYRLRSAGDTDGDGADELLAFGSSQTLLVGKDGVRARFTEGEQVAPAGDVDGDGLADIAMISATYRLGVWLGPQAGEPAVDLDLTPASPFQLPVALADTTADVDGDGLSDVVSLVTELDYAYSDVYSCYLGIDDQLVFYEWYFCASHLAVLADPARGAPTGPVLADTYGLSELWPELSAVDPLALSLDYASALHAVGDLDGNGVQDAAVYGHQGRIYTQQVLLNPGEADSRLIELRGPAADGAQVAGRFDLDADGGTDVVTSWWDGVGHHVAVAYGPWEGQADLDLEVVVADRAALTGAVEAVDLDGDGGPDIAVGTSDGLAVYAGAAIVAGAVPAEPLPAYAPWDGCADVVAPPRSLDPSGTPPLAGDLVAADAGVHVFGDYAWHSTLRVGDFDGDGADDLALGNLHWVWYDNEQGTAAYVVRDFAMGESRLVDASQVIPGDPDHPFGTLLDAADMDGDGADDLFAGSPGQQVWLLGGGATGLACPQETTPTVTELAILAGPDFDGDGGRDLVVRHADEQVAVLASPDWTTRISRFTPPPQSSLHGDPVLVDWDGDGIPEAAIPLDTTTNNDVWVLDLTLTGTFTMEDAAIARRTHDNGQHTVAAAGDIDGDGKDDVWVAYPYDAGMASSSPGRIYGLGGGAPEGDVVGSSLATYEGEGQSYLGTELAGGGDTDGDGAPELLAGGVSWNDRAWLFRDPSAGTHPLGEAVATFTGGADDVWLEGPLAFADIDVDGVDDVVLSAHELVPYQLPVGSILVYFGGDR